MRIISDFKDYYDGMMAHDDDKETVFLRNTKTHKLDHDSKIYIPYIQHHRVENNRKTYYVFHLIIGFAHQIHKCIYISKSRKEQDVVVYNTPSDRIKGFVTTHDQKIFFNDQIQNPDNLFRAYGPIFLIHKSNPWNDPYDWNIRNKIFVTSNPQLEGLGFASILPPAIAFNELKKFIWNVAQPPIEIPERSNELKIEQAGFNVKTSFRKGKI